ncbi:MAG: hypothetical protein IJ087_19860 [Eggerthellaceae bacterium]|nr:hypothetical protein [Eggerthellaceae bacterium]
MDINIVYIDDGIDPELSRYLDEVLPSSLAEKQTKKRLGDIAVSYREIVYVPGSGFEQLLANPLLQKANIAIIDSKLFETKTSAKEMLTGEEFLIILKKYYPFIESIVISQIESRRNEEPLILPKWNRIDYPNTDPADFYAEQLLPKICESIASIRAYRRASAKLSTDTVDEVTIEKLRNAIAGQQEYDELTKSDIDAAISYFEEVKKLVTDASR